MLIEKKEQDINELALDALYDEFLDLIVNGRGYKGIADFLAQKLKVSILIEDEFFRVLARSFFEPPNFSYARNRNKTKYWKPQHVDPRIINFVRIAQSTGQPVELPELPEYGINKSRVVFPITIKNKFNGALHVFEKDLDRNQMRIINAALYSLVVLKINRQVQVELEEKIKKSLIIGLLSEDKDSNIYREKQILGFDLFREAVLAVIQIKSAGQLQVEKVLSSIINDIKINASATAIDNQETVLLIQPDEGCTLESALITESLQVIFEALKMIFKDCKVKIGVGRQCFKLSDYKAAFSEACKALTLSGPKPGEEEGVIYYHSLRLMEILLQSGNKQALPLFVQRILGKLYDYSVAHNTNLIESLGCYLEHNCCIQSAARELFVHPNTLRYRLEKAVKISGLDLASHDTKLEVQLALKLHSYYGDSIFKG